jgi:GNAT superfamily N-acetyltransferase
MPMEQQEQVTADKLALRIAESGDAENVAYLVNLAFRTERFFIDGDRTSPQKVLGLLQKGKFLLAEQAGALLGCVYVERHGERGYFGLLAVDPARQRAGLGSHLIDAAEQYCHAAGCRFMELTIVNLRKELPEYYLRHGYRESGTLPFPADQHPPKVACHLVRMSKALG